MKKFSFVIFLLIILAGVFLRFYNLDWDQGHFFHPDERNIAAAVSRISFFHNLNPEFFAYGSLPIYFFRLTGEIVFYITKDPGWISDWAKINLISRFFSALASSATIVVFFLFLKKYFSLALAVLSCFFIAFSPSLIQSAHFGVTESLLLFFLSLILYLSFQFQEKPQISSYLETGFVCGLALATKISSLSFLLIPVIIHFISNFKFTRRHGFFLGFLLVAFLTFTIFSPYAFLSRAKFLESMNYETGVALGRLKVVYVLQFEKTLPYLFQMKNFFWQMGPVAGAGLIGFVFLLFQLIKTRQKKLFYLLSFPLLYFLYVGSWYTKFLRYQTPVLPFLAIFASFLLLEIQKRFQKTGNLLIIFFLLTSFFWSVAFFSIYTRESTRITASKWIYQNIPPGSKILGEHWDDGLPLTINDNNPSLYKIEPLTIYDADDQNKINYYAEKLATADYLVLNSRRLYGTLINLPEKYPITSRYYQLLFSGQLGYTKIVEFTSYPNFFGLQINDDSSEETFQVYDHPKVMVFQNNDKISKEELKKRLSL